MTTIPITREDCPIPLVTQLLHALLAVAATERHQSTLPIIQKLPLARTCIAELQISRFHLTPDTWETNILLTFFDPTDKEYK
jgi:type III secretory pathway component EscU